LTECFRNPEIYHQFEFCCLKHSKVCGLFAREYASGMVAGETVWVGQVSSIAKQPSGITPHNTLKFWRCGLHKIFPDRICGGTDALDQAENLTASPSWPLRRRSQFPARLCLDLRMH
jgi:hypothetical protein